jgi:hypothetical protein
MESGQVVEEIYYQYPGKFKASADGATSIVQDGVYNVIDNSSGKIVDKRSVNLSELDVLKSLFIPNFKWLSEYYDFKVEVLSQPPHFVESVYDFHSSGNVYLLTGSLKQGATSPYYPDVIKIEHIIDTHLGLSVGVRHYWIGILGSGRSDDLACQWAVNQVETKNGIFLPKTGTTTGQVNESWTIEVLKLNKGFNEGEFSIESFQP